MATLLAVVSIALGASLAYFSLRCWLAMRKTDGVSWSWIKFAQALVGLYWLAVYVYVTYLELAGLYVVAGYFGRIVVRPGLIVTLAVMTAGAIMRWRQLRCG